MRHPLKVLPALLLAMTAGLSPATASPTHFDHIVLIIQENRTPDNLFYVLCRERPCSVHPQGNQYDIQLANWRDKNASGGTVNPRPLPLAVRFSPQHSHTAFLAMCDRGPGTACRMDGAGDIVCKGCAPNTEFTYVDNSHGMIDPYLFIAENYGWANYMFQTNQGPSFPAHQFLFGGTSAPSKANDRRGTFAAENARHNNMINGCVAPIGTQVALINAIGTEFTNVYPCFDHKTLGDLLDTAKVSWRYYTPGAGDLWSAPDAIRHICEPSKGVCTGAIWRRHLALVPPIFLGDVQKCALPKVSWVIPAAAYSDHAGTNDGSGPNWVAALINAIGQSKCTNADGSSYWNSTAIVITWDDWGGFYDHEPPTFLPYPQGGYQYGFRVPLLFVSAYTPQGYINNDRQDFGDIVRFVEFNFGITMGKLTFADSRSTGNLAKYYDLSASPRDFKTVPGGPITGILNGTVPLDPPDDD